MKRRARESMWTLKWLQGKPCEGDRIEELKTFEEAGREKKRADVQEERNAKGAELRPKKSAAGVAAAAAAAGTGVQVLDDHHHWIEKQRASHIHIPPFKLFKKGRQPGPELILKEGVSRCSSIGR